MYRINAHTNNCGCLRLVGRQDLGYNEHKRGNICNAARQEGLWGMDLYNNYGQLIFMLILTVFLLVLTHINHSRDTMRCRILKLSIWILLISQLFDIFRTQVCCEGIVYSEPAIYVIFVGYYLSASTVMILIVMYMLMQFPQLTGRTQLLYTIFFVCECTVFVLFLPTNLTGFAYSIKMGRFVSGIADELFFMTRLIVLIGFLIAVWLGRRFLAPKLFQNWTAMLVLAVGIHVMALFVNNLHVFGFFANVFLATAFFMFHSGTYEEGTARMGADMYRSELDYHLAKKRDFYIFEIQIRNYDRLVERRLYSEEEMDGLYGMFAAKLTGERKDIMLFQKKYTSLGVIIPQMHPEEAVQLAEKMRDWMSEFFGGKPVFGIAAAECPKYAGRFVDAERLLRFLQKKCPKNNYYFCDETDYEEFCERDEILRLLHDMHLEKQDVVLFGRPIIECRNSRVTRFEILCRLQMAGKGIVHSEHVIRLAEQYGYIHDVNMEVLANVCDFLMTETAIRQNLKVLLHISGEELEKPGFAEDVLEIIRDYDLTPEALGFEVTMMPGECDISRMREVMSTLREHRIVFVLTDFDPSIVNFESVMGLPFETIKFERHCVMRASDNALCYDVMGMLVDLFKEHGFQVAFKGIDNAKLEEIALSLNADFVQGEKYTKPFPIERIEEQTDLQAMY